MESHLLQMRGLKRYQHRSLHTIVWSHLLQMRGLKQTTELQITQAKQSHLLQMRGLKPTSSGVMRFAPFCRIFYRCVD